MQIELYLDGKPITDYNAVWDSKRSVLIVNIETKSYRVNTQPNISNSSVSQINLDYVDVYKIFPQHVLELLQAYTKHILNPENVFSDKDTETFNKYFAPLPEEQLNEIQKLKFSVNDYSLDLVIQKILKYTASVCAKGKNFAWLNNFLRIKEDIKNFLTVQSQDDLNIKLKNERIKSLAKMMLEEKSEALKQAGCTKCKINSILKKYSNLLKQLDLTKEIF